MGKRVKIEKVPQALIDHLDKKAKEGVYVPLDNDPEYREIKEESLRKAAGKKPKRKIPSTFGIFKSSNPLPFEREEEEDPYRYPTEH
jgi:hypothetical protein